MSALLHNPDVLLFDEPFTNLDVTTVTLMKTMLPAARRDGEDGSVLHAHP